jgi:hypothetical protein
MRLIAALACVARSSGVAAGRWTLPQRAACGDAEWAKQRQEALRHTSS